jgi:DNA-binding CsgD family transcriptional regulator
MHQLTPKEEEVIGWVAKGKTNWEISRILDRSEATVRTHVQHIMAKLQTTSRTQTVALWVSMRHTATSSEL